MGGWHWASALFRVAPYPIQPVAFVRPLRGTATYAFVGT
jgi:hypothetical protein